MATNRLELGLTFSSIIRVELLQLYIYFIQGSIPDEIQGTSKTGAMSYSLGYLILERCPYDELLFGYMLETLNYIQLFQDLKPGQIAQLDPLFERLTFAPNTTLFAQDQPANYLYILLKGKAAITYKPYDGPSITITHLQTGAVFGWSAVVGSKQYTSSSCSLTDVEVARVLTADLWKFVHNHPETGEFLLNRIASSVSTRWANAHIQVQAMLDKGRLT